jgi:tRNA(Ile)-lysidine synthase
LKPPAEGQELMSRAMHSTGSAFSAARLGEALARLPAIERLWVAFSGGADSLALLHAMCELRGRSGCAEVAAVHVNHGLHARADDWQERCRRVCADLDVPLEVRRVDAGAAPGESPEAAARRARYDALAALVETHDAVCTAHHQRDQAETLLLQLVRGAGPAGLAAMPALARLGKGWLARPLLDSDPQALREYLVQCGVEWIEDPSNADLRFDRNYLRHEILPRLEARWPGVQRTLARAAAHQAEAAALVAELAHMDLGDSRADVPGTLSAPALLRLPAPRARNLLRGWLAERGLPAAGATHLEQILEELVKARDDAQPLVSWPGVEVRRYRERIYAWPPMPPHDAARVMVWDPQQVLALPHGELEAEPVEGRGLAVERCRQARLEVRFRQGGERFQPAGRRHSTALKKLLQTSAVPPWLRDRIPLIYVDGELAAVAGLWVGQSFAVADGESGWVLKWSELPEIAA